MRNEAATEVGMDEQKQKMHEAVFDLVRAHSSLWSRDEQDGANQAFLVLMDAMTAAGVPDEHVEFVRRVWVSLLPGYE